MMPVGGLLCYDAADVPRNQWFISTLQRLAEPEGLSLRLSLTGDRFPADCRPEFVLNRSRNAKISELCEETLGIPVFNSGVVTRITNDKYRTHCFLRAAGLPTAGTWLVSEGEPLPVLPLPLVAKPADGHGGQGVTWLKDEAALLRYAADAQRPFLLQEPMVTGWDLRLYVLNGECYAAVLRTSGADFRSNFTLGGSAAVIQPDREALALLHRVQQILPLDFAGVDLLRHPDGGYVIGEIEDAVGCRMLYALTDRDPAKDYIRMAAGVLSDRIKRGS